MKWFTEKSDRIDLFSSRAKGIIASIPVGRVATYGQIAMLSGNRRAARQIAWILHSSSSKYNLPWHRVINRMGKISLPRGGGYEEQKSLLIKEGVRFDRKESIDLGSFGWNPGRDRELQTGKGKQDKK
jgi:methylated-DNA-protein-cysteine methyltransferase-like protein